MDVDDGTQHALQLMPDGITWDALVAPDPRDQAHLSEKESFILELYDQIQDLQLERALLESEDSTSDGHFSESNVENQVKVAQQQLLEAKATYSVRKKFDESVLKSPSILKSIHETEDATIPERVLFPLINRRDVLSLVYEDVVKKVHATLDSMSKAETENLRVTARNRELVQSLLEVTNERRDEKGDIENSELKERIQTLEIENHARKGKWRTLKGVLISVIVASGVDWARDEELCSLVLDGE